MNIFVLDVDQEKCVAKYCDLHVRKMLLETAQILCSVHPAGSAPYKRTHYNHPCVVWARQSVSNYKWLGYLGLYLVREYQKRFRKGHKSAKIIRWCCDNVPEGLPDMEITPWPQVMPDEYKTEDDTHYGVVAAYKRYYRDKLRDFKQRSILDE